MGNGFGQAALRAILPVIEDIAPVDQVIKELTAGWNVRIQFQMPVGILPPR